MPHIFIHCSLKLIPLIQDELDKYSKSQPKLRFQNGTWLMWTPILILLRSVEIGGKLLLMFCAQKMNYDLFNFLHNSFF